MKQHQGTFVTRTDGQGLYLVTQQIRRIVHGAGIELGLATVFLRHTSASLIINENADPDVPHDLQAFLARLVPDGDPLYRHVAEGPDDMPAHVKAALTATSLAIPVSGGAMVLGTWQGIYLWEHRQAPHHRSIVVHVQGG